MDKQREEELIRRSLELHPWPTEEEMAAFVKECDANPETIQELMAQLEKVAHRETSSKS